MPRHYLRRARREDIAGAATDSSGADEESLSSRSDSRASWASARTKEVTSSQEPDSISISTAASHTGNQESSNMLKACTICTDALVLSHFPARAPTELCTHPPTICSRCLRKWIDYSFKMRVWNQIDCPVCDQRLQHADVKAFADPELAVKYEEFATKAAIEAIPGFRWCTAKRCDSGQVHDGEDLSKFVCVECKVEQCVVHDVLWHQNETCAEYEHRYAVIIHPGV